MAKSLAQRLYSDDAYIAVARAVRYFTLPCSDVVEKLKDALNQHGREKLDTVAKELLIIEGTHPSTTARLRDDVRMVCRQLLGPLPEEWDEFYANVENPPPNPYRSKEPSPDKQTQPHDESQNAALIDTGLDTGPVESSHIPRRMVPPPEMTAQEMLRRLGDKELQLLIDDARAGLIHHGAKSRHGRQLRRDLTAADAELARRGGEAGNPSEIDLIRSMHGRKLRKLLLSEHAHFRDYPPGHHFHDEAVRRMELLETEMRRRGNKVPIRPSLPTTMTAPTTSQQHDDADDIDVVAEALANTIQMETGMGCVVAHPDEIRRFREATTHRLNELLDMNQYEVARYGPETVTHQEAARDVALITSELRRRKAL